MINLLVAILVCSILFTIMEIVWTYIRDKERGVYYTDTILQYFKKYYIADKNNTLIASIIFNFLVVGVVFGLYCFFFVFVPQSMHHKELKDQLIQQHLETKCPECEWIVQTKFANPASPDKESIYVVGSYRWKNCPKLMKELTQKIKEEEEK